ncbi:glycosyltransferase family 4 protein [Halolactibacillus sp. JCM 19043]|uniref:glycosyltransferase family 4 protein n=1 Tax=Halolactibacillus sp. JCM 19043 TaxID=1460638 RepID=UPI0018CFF67F|nr:glycosyltransferase family 4 protein [Halolactibacillus sp. JCM 19043]
MRDLWPDSLEGVKVFNYSWLINSLRKFEKKMYNVADLIVVNSPAFEKHIYKMLGDNNKKILFLPNGARLNELQKASANKDGFSSFSIVYAGNLGLAQNIEQLMLLIKKLHAHDILVNLVGYGLKSKKLKEFIEENELSNVIFHKPMSRRDSLKIISNCNLSVVFLADEAVFTTVLPGKILDYMTCETPVIAGVKGEAANVIKESNGGIVFNPGEIDKMIDTIVTLSNNKEEMNRLEENCKNYILKNYIWEENILELIQVIKCPMEGCEKR